MLPRWAIAPLLRPQRQTFRTLSSSTGRQYDTIVVGGGIAGVSTAWQLAKRKQKVLLLEQNTLTSGSTWHAAGLVTNFKGSPAIAELASYGRDVFVDIQATEGLPIGWHQTGSLGIARSAASAEAMLQNYMQGSYQGHPHRVIEDWETIKKLNPFLANPRGDFVVGVHSADNGIVNPADATMALAKRAKAAGATILENTGVKTFTLSSNKRYVKSAITVHGEEIFCGNVVLCASAWTRKLAKEIGEFVPLAYAPHQYTIFDKIPGVTNELPVTREYDHHFYMKPEVGAFMLGVFEAQPIPHTEEFILERSKTGVVPVTAANEVFEENFDKFGPHFEGAMEVFPCLQECGIRTTLHGPDIHSPDHGFVMGPLLSVDNAYIASGFNSQGIQTGPGVGLALAEWVLDGYPMSFKNHFQDLNVGRFNPEILKKDDWVTYRALECYGVTYKPHFPREQDATVRGLALKSPFYDATVRKGGVFGEAFGYERPLYFDPGYKKPEGFGNEWEELTPHPSKAPTPPHSCYAFEFKDAAWFPIEKAEAKHCREEVVAFDMSPFGKISVKGPDALKLVQYAVTGQMDKTPGSITYTSFCVPTTGGILGDLTVCRQEDDEFYCVLPAADPFVFAKHLRQCQDALGGSLDVRVRTCTDEIATLAVMGPKSRRLMKALFPHVQWDNGSFPFGTFQEIDLPSDSPVRLQALRVSFAGELGWELHIPAGCAMAVYDALFSIAKDKGIDLRDAGMWSLLQSLRIEKGFVHNGHDIHPKITPMEAGLAFTVDWKKGDFAGRAALEARRTSRKRLISFQLLDTEKTPHGHYADILYRNGQKVGYLTSTGYSHTLDAPIALGFVDLPSEVAKKPKAWLEEGDYEIELLHRGKILRTPARASFSCLVDPRSTRVHGEDGDIGEDDNLRPAQSKVHAGASI